MSKQWLDQLLGESVTQHAGCVAVVEPGVANIRYAELNRLADRISDTLREKDARPGDSVGIYLANTIYSGTSDIQRNIIAWSLGLM